jgi:predicted secreted protein
MVHFQGKAKPKGSSGDQVWVYRAGWQGVQSLSLQRRRQLPA